MRKHIFAIIAGVIALFAIFLIVTAEDDAKSIESVWASDLLFEYDPKINTAELTIDYIDDSKTQSRLKNNTLYGTITAHYTSDTSGDNKVMLPFATTLNLSNYSSLSCKNVSIKIDGIDIDVKPSYGESINPQDKMSEHTYQGLKDLEYESQIDSDKYYIYEYSNKDTVLGINSETINSTAIFYFGMKEIIPRELATACMNGKVPGNVDSSKQSLFLLNPDNFAFIISKTKLDSNDLTDLGVQSTAIGCDNTYKYILDNACQNKDNISYSDTILVLENEINPLWNEIGLHSFNCDEIVDTIRVSFYEFVVPSGHSEIEFSYEAFAGVDFRYSTPRYHGTYKPNSKNFRYCDNFKVNYKISSIGEFEKVPQGNWRKIDNSYVYEGNLAPWEIDIAFSYAENSSTVFERLIVKIATLVKLIIIPTLLCLIVVLALIKLFKYYEEKRINIIEEAKRILKLIGNNIPEILTFYFVGFTFHNIYSQNSGFTEINVLLASIFLLISIVYIAFKTGKKISWIKFGIIALLALATTILSINISLVLIMTLALCYIEKGGKSYLKAMYLAIAYFFIQTLVLNAYSIIPGEAGELGYSLGFANRNIASVFLFIGALCYLLYKDKASNINRLIITIICGVVFLLTKASITSFATLLLVVVDLLADYIKLKGKWRYGFVILFPALVAVSFLVAYNFGQYNTDFDMMLNHRPAWICDYLVSDNFTWFSLRGQRLIAGKPIDNLYMNTFVLEGTIVFAIYTIIYIMTTIFVIKSKNTRHLFALIVFFILALFSSELMYYSCAVFVVLYFISAFARKKYNIVEPEKEEEPVEALEQQANN